MYMKDKRSILILCFIYFSTLLFAQQSKNGAKVIAAANTIVNEYIDLKADIAVGDLSLIVGSNTLNANGRFPSGALAAGDLIFIYQTRGATIIGHDVIGWGTGQPRDSTLG